MRIQRKHTPNGRLSVTLTEADVDAMTRGLSTAPRGSLEIDEVETVLELIAPDDDGLSRCEVDPRVARSMLVALAVGTSTGDLDQESWTALTSADDSMNVISVRDDDITAVVRVGRRPAGRDRDLRTPVLAPA